MTDEKKVFKRPAPECFARFRSEKDVRTLPHKRNRSAVIGGNGTAGNCGLPEGVEIFQLVHLGVLDELEVRQVVEQFLEQTDFPVIRLLRGVGKRDIFRCTAGKLHQIIQKEVTADSRIECTTEVFLLERFQKRSATVPVEHELSGADRNIGVEIEHRPGKFHPGGIADQCKVCFRKNAAQTCGIGQKETEIPQLIEPEYSDFLSTSL